MRATAQSAAIEIDGSREAIADADPQAQLGETVRGLALRSNELDDIRMIVAEDCEVRARPAPGHRHHVGRASEELGECDRPRRVATGALDRCTAGTHAENSMPMPPEPCWIRAARWSAP